MKGNWVNTKRPIWKHIVRPCHLTHYCPYGGIVEMFPLDGDDNGRGDMSCEEFGHDCPAYYNAEMIYESIVDEDIESDNPRSLINMEIDEFQKELDENAAKASRKNRK